MREGWTDLLVEDEKARRVLYFEVVDFFCICVVSVQKREGGRGMGGREVR